MLRLILAITLPLIFTLILWVPIYLKLSKNSFSELLVKLSSIKFYNKILIILTLLVLNWGVVYFIANNRKPSLIDFKDLNSTLSLQQIHFFLSSDDYVKFNKEIEKDILSSVNHSLKNSGIFQNSSSKKPLNLRFFDEYTRVDNGYIYILSLELSYWVKDKENKITNSVIIPNKSSLTYNDYISTFSLLFSQMIDSIVDFEKIKASGVDQAIAYLEKEEPLPAISLLFIEFFAQQNVAVPDTVIGKFLEVNDPNLHSRVLGYISEHNRCFFMKELFEFALLFTKDYLFQTLDIISNSSCGEVEGFLRVMKSSPQKDTKERATKALANFLDKKSIQDIKYNK
ncbi:hypothetical protein JXR93_01810 [bacterium]|nr:hypothetical protein [bacterium]